MAAEWSQLPRELIGEISNRLKSPIDTLRFRSVCSTWREAAATTINPHPPIFHDLSLSKRSFFILSPNTNCGSWVIKIKEKTPQNINLFYPLTNTQINSLPKSFPKFIDLLNIRIHELGHEYFFDYTNEGSDLNNLHADKVAVLNHGEGDFLVLAIHVSGTLAVFNNADKLWRFVNDFQSPYDDVIAYNGEFYAVDNMGRVVVVGVGSDESVTVVVDEPICGGDKKRLVEMGGELLLVDVYIGLPPYNDDNFDANLDDFITSRWMWFKVFRLDRDGQKWVKVKSLGNYILFLGVNCAFSASALDLGLPKGNCIYFNFPDKFVPLLGDEYDDAFKYHCGCVYDFEDASISYSKLFWPPPAWIYPSSSEEN